MTSLQIPAWMQPSLAEIGRKKRLAEEQPIEGRAIMTMLVSGVMGMVLLAAGTLTTTGPTPAERMFFWCAIGGSFGALVTYCLAGHKTSVNSLLMHCIGNLAVSIALGPACSFGTKSMAMWALKWDVAVDIYLVVTVTFFLGLIGLGAIKYLRPKLMDLLKSTTVIGMALLKGGIKSALEKIGDDKK